MEMGDQLGYCIGLGKIWEGPDYGSDEGNGEIRSENSFRGQIKWRGSGEVDSRSLTGIVS